MIYARAEVESTALTGAVANTRDTWRIHEEVWLGVKWRGPTGWWGRNEWLRRTDSNRRHGG